MKKKIRFFYLNILSFLEVKFSVYLNRRVFVMASILFSTLVRKSFFALLFTQKKFYANICHNAKPFVVTTTYVYQQVYNSHWFKNNQIFQLFITKTCLYNIDPLKPHFYIVKLGFTGVYIIFLISVQKHRLWVLVRTASPMF